MSRWLGIDVGTSAVKALVADDVAGVVARARVGYEGETVAAMAHGEQDVRGYEMALAQALRACGTHVRDVDGIGVVGQTPTCVFLDARGRPLRPALTWQDGRASREAAELAARFGDTDRLIGTRLPWSASFPPARLLWLLRSEPEIAAACRWVVQPKDFIVLRLTGSCTSDRWSSKGLCNVATGEPAGVLLEGIGWPAAVCPAIGDPWSVAGTVTAEAAERFGLPAGVPVTIGWSDALAGMLAAGAFETALGFVLSGTSDIVGISFAEGAPAVPGLLTIPPSCAPLPVVYGPTQSSGASIAWLAGILGVDEAEISDLAGRSTASEPPVFIPYLAGERAPLWNRAVRGSFVRLDAGHTAADLARGVLLGVALSAQHIFGLASARVPNPATVTIAGRHANTRGWRAARLEAMGRPMAVLAEPDTSSLGAAMLGAMAAGRSLADVAALRGETICVLPEPGHELSSAALMRLYLTASTHCVALAS
jgi:xylulokinase